MSPAVLLGIKVGLAAAVGGVGISGALLPWRLGSRASSERVMALSDTFAGGVLGGAGLIHLLGGAIAGFRQDVPGLAYPLPLLLAGVGFLLILLIEGVIAADPHAGHRPMALQHETGWHPEVTRPMLYPAVLLAVLSVHSVILGLAMGAQSTISGLLIVFVAIVAHKGAAGFALGVGYRRAGFSQRRALPQLSFFSTMTPIGIVAGAVVGALLAGNSSILFESIFDAIGAGTFLYIASLDILKTEFDTPGYRAQKWLAACLGFGLMALIAIWL